MTDEKFEEFIEQFRWYDGDVDRYDIQGFAREASPRSRHCMKYIITFLIGVWFGYVIHPDEAPLLSLLCRTVIPILFVIVALWPLMETVITVFRELPNIPTGLNTL